MTAKEWNTLRRAGERDECAPFADVTVAETLRWLDETIARREADRSKL